MKKKLTKKLTKKKLLEQLNKLKTRKTEFGSLDKEANHSDADDLLIEYINDPKITEAYNKIEKWYA